MSPDDPQVRARARLGGQAARRMVLAAAQAPRRMLAGVDAPGRTVLAAVVAVQLVIGLLVVGVGGSGVPAPSEAAAISAVTTPPGGMQGADSAAGAPAAGADPAPGARRGASPQPAAAPAPSSAADPAPAPGNGDTGPLVVPEPGPPPPADPLSPDAPSPVEPPSAPATTVAASAPASQSEDAFARQHPAQAEATQREDDPSSFHWAVIVGVNDYMGRTSSTIGSVNDARALRDTLLREGWRHDHVLTITDHAATREEIVRAIEWLVRSTDHRSTVVFSFSGHMRHNSGTTALWPADNQFIWADELGRLLGAVRADRLWASLQGCHAAGLAAPGVEGANRLVTYAARAHEKAYEDPATGHSVMGHYLFAEGLRDGYGDRNAGNGDGHTSVQEAFAWAAPRATARTNGQSHGAQRPVQVDGLGGREFSIAVTGAPGSAGERAADPPRDDGDSADDADDDADRRRLIELPRVRVHVPRPFSRRG